MTATLQTLPSARSARKKHVTSSAVELTPEKVVDVSVERVEAKRKPNIGARPRITLHERGLTIEHPDLFADPATERGRLFLSRVFSVQDIESVEIDRSKGLARLLYSLAATIPRTLRQLREVLVRPVDAPRLKIVGSNVGTDTDRAVDALFLQTAEPFPIRISRVGQFLSTWRIHVQGEGRVLLSHPILRGRRDVVYRLEEELTAVQGVREFKVSSFSSSITVRFNSRRVDVPRLLRHLEHCWPRLIHGLAGPPARTRLFASFALLSSAFVGQYFLPVITPYVLVAMIAYSFTNVVNAVKQLTQGKVGLPLLYTGTITFTTLSGMPFAATFMATWMQLWPRWSMSLLNQSQRRLFATHRQRATWARRVGKDGRLSEVLIDILQKGDHVVVYEGEILPVDGVVVDGLAAVDEEALTGRAGALDKAPGDFVYAATYIKTGQITVSVSLIGVETLAGFIGEQLPHGFIEQLPSSAEAERIATRMVAPALALSAANLMLGGPIQASQSTIRPDYATGPRFSAQLAALHDLSDALRRGIVFRDPAALCRLPATDIYVFDDTPALSRREIAVGNIFAVRRGSTTKLLSYVTSAFPAFQNERARALMDEALNRRAPLLEITNRARHAGSISYLDPEGDTIEVATSAYVESRKIKVPSAIADAMAEVKNGRHNQEREPLLRPLWVIRNGTILGVVTFERTGELEAVETIAVLKARNPRATFVYISEYSQQEATVIANRIGIPTVYAGLNPVGKADVLKQLGRRAMWIGDGSNPESLPCIQSATISISVGGASTLPIDAANVILLQPSLRGLVPLRRIGRHHRSLIKEGYRAVFAANLFCVGGAFFGGFNTLAVAIVSNLATGYVYSIHRNLLRDLIARMESKMAKEMAPESEDTHEAASYAEAHEIEQQEDYDEQDLDAVMPQETPV